jgi:hypothetical protein
MHAYLMILYVMRYLSSPRNTPGMLPGPGTPLVSVASRHPSRSGCTQGGCMRISMGSCVKDGVRYLNYRIMQVLRSASLDYGVITRAAVHSKIL